MIPLLEDVYVLKDTRVMHVRRRIVQDTPPSRGEAVMEKGGV